MKVGDLVMFKPEGNYAKWFGGEFAEVESCKYNSDGKLHCRVRWLRPVPYFDKHATISDFGADKFVVYDNKIPEDVKPTKE